mmetsp:Transcript_52884/g.140939  ORF Transcript_52884/g.140939 Transcript_52884/m.140939 type:complete len:218 (+) Transcript_52884:111-764(+)
MCPMRKSDVVDLDKPRLGEVVVQAGAHNHLHRRVRRHRRPPRLRAHERDPPGALRRGADGRIRRQLRLGVVGVWPRRPAGAGLCQLFHVYRRMTLVLRPGPAGVVALEEGRADDPQGPQRGLLVHGHERGDAQLGHRQEVAQVHPVEVRPEVDAAPLVQVLEHPAPGAGPGPDAVRGVLEGGARDLLLQLRRRSPRRGAGAAAAAGAPVDLLRPRRH